MTQLKSTADAFEIATAVKPEADVVDMKGKPYVAPQIAKLIEPPAQQSSFGNHWGDLPPLQYQSAQPYKQQTFSNRYPVGVILNTTKEERAKSRARQSAYIASLG